MKITDKVYKIIVILVIAGIVIPFASALGANSVDSSQTINPEEIQETSSLLPEISLFSPIMVPALEVPKTLPVECSLVGVESFGSVLQGQTGINLYQPLDCYSLTVSAPLKHLDIQLAKIKNEFNVKVVVDAGQQINSHNYQTGQSGFPELAYVGLHQVELRESKNDSIFEAISLPRLSNNSKISFKHYTHKELQIFLC